MPSPSTPTFRSLSQILGDMAATFLAELDSRGVVPGIQSLKAGSPYLATLEAVAQSQFRNQEQTLTLLDANDLDLARGERLDRIGAAERLLRRGATFATGSVDVSDTSFQRVSTQLYLGRSSPIPGALTLYVSDASEFPASGSLYVGRGTRNLEGPLAYTSRASAGSYWSVTLAAGTANFHAAGEPVTLAQGGDRVVPAGQVVQTPQGNAGTAATYATTSTATLLDGETLVTGVPVSSRTPGTAGNAPVGAVKVVPSPAFSGMAVTNSLPLNNGLDVEDDDQYRERIRTARRARTGVGTALGLTVYSYGVKAPDESTTVATSQYIHRVLLPSVLVVDDGTGYEAKDAGVALEVLTDSAFGGEQTFFLARGRPVAKAYVATLQSAPFALSDRSVLTVLVGGVTYAHAFGASEFSDVSAATAYEVVASINSDPTVPFAARTSALGKKVAVFAKDDVQDDVEVVPTPYGADANEALFFPTGRTSAVRLYKNDVELWKDGVSAAVTSTNQASWSPTSSGETLVLSVDGTPVQAYSLLDSDVAALGSGYHTLSSSLPLSVWAALIQSKVPGVSCSVSGNSLVVASNLGPSSRASVSVDPSSTLVAKGLFDALHLSDTGRSRDYVLDRNRGQIDLTKPLLPGDRLTAGTSATRAYLQSAVLGSTVNVPSPGAAFWFVVDGGAVQVRHYLNSSNRLRQDWTSQDRTFTAFVGAGVSPAYPFTAVQAGDVAIWSEDPWSGFGGAPATYSVMRVAEVDPAGQWVKCDYPTTGGGTGTSYNNPALTAYNRLYFVRTAAVPQLVSVPAGTYTQAQLAALLSLRGAAATVVGSRLRVTTDTYPETGDVALSAQDSVALALGFAVGSATQNDEPELAAVESGNSDIGTCDTLSSLAVTSFSGTTHVGSALAGGAQDGCCYGGYWLRSPGAQTSQMWWSAVMPYGTGSYGLGAFGGVVASEPPALATGKWGTNAGDGADWTGVTGVPEVVLDHLLAPARSAVDMLASVSHFRVGPLGTLSVTFDQDPEGKAFSVPMTRWLKVDPAVPYGQVIRLLDADNPDGSSNPQSLALAFGTGFNFSNFVLHSHSRARLDLSATQPGSSDVLVVRLKSWAGRDSTASAYVRAPLAAGAALSVSNLSPGGDLVVYLSSGADRGVSFASSSHLRADQASPSTTATFCSALRISSISRAGSTVTVVLSRPTTDVQSSGFLLGDSVYVTTSDPNFPSGLKTVASVSTAAFTNDTITYTEAGSAGAGSSTGAYVGREASPTDFTPAHVDDYLIAPNSYWSTSDAIGALSARMRVIGKDSGTRSLWVQVAATTLTPGWKTVVNSSDLSIFPLANNTTSAVVAAVNALTGASASAALAGGPGTGVISQVEEVKVKGKLADGLLHVSSASYNALAQNYDFTLKLAPDPTLTSPPNDWSHEEFRLAPTTARNVSDYLARGQVTGLAAAGADVEVSSRGRKVQLASGTLGSGGAVQVTGGTANSLLLPVLSATLTQSAIVVSTPASPALEAGLSNRSCVLLENSVALPKSLDWTSATTLTALAGQVKVSVAGSAWSYSSVDPLFGTRWLFQRVGKYVIAVPTTNAATVHAPGEWVRFESGFGRWGTASSRASSVVGSAYATLSDGRVLVMGGDAGGYDVSGVSPSTSVEAYDPTTDSWYTMTPLPAGRAYGAACTLANGRVLYTGGIGPAAAWKSDAYVFDPSAGALGTDGRPQGAWTPTAGSMSSVRSHHTATLLSTGKVLVAGGATSQTTVTATADIFDPNTNLFTLTGSMRYARAGHAAFLFGLDQVLVVGGRGAGLVGYETYVSSLAIWANDRALGFGETRVGHAVCQLSPTTFLVAGGSANEANINPATWTNLKSTCEVYDAVLHVVFPAGPMAVARAGHGAALFGTKVVSYGGLASLPVRSSPSVVPQRSAEVMDISTLFWSFASATAFPHLLAPPLLSYGTRMVVAGAYYSGGPQPSVEKYDASLLSAPAGNHGLFRVLSEASDHLMIDAPGAVDGEYQFGFTAVYSYDSVLPEDVLRVSSSTLGNAAAGTYAVTSVDLYDQTKFSIAAATTFSTGALGSQLPLVSIIAAKPAKMLYTVHSVVPDDVNPGQTLLALHPTVGTGHFSESADSVLTAQDKLEFPTTTVTGQDAYRYNTGLIAQVTKVVYGDEGDHDTYPGYAAEGAVVDVAAPLIRRVKVALSVRVRAGAANVLARVRAAVAKVVNSAPPGPIAISIIVEEVQQVSGVLSVVVVSPAPAVGADYIPVQQHEKAMVLDPLSDVQVSVIGS